MVMKLAEKMTLRSLVKKLKFSVLKTFHCTPWLAVFFSAETSMLKTFNFTPRFTVFFSAENINFLLGMDSLLFKSPQISTVILTI